MSSGKSMATSIQRHIVLAASILALSGCAGVTELVRDVITGLADIDVSGVTDLFGGGKVELSPEQTAQLAKIFPPVPCGATARKKVRRRYFLSYSKRTPFTQPPPRAVWSGLIRFRKGGRIDRHQAAAIGRDRHRGRLVARWNFQRRGSCIRQGKW